MADNIQQNQEVTDRLTALEIHMEYTVKGIGDLKKMVKSYTDNPCEKCSLSEEVTINRTDIRWMKRITYILGAPAAAGIIGLLIDRFTGIIDKLTKGM